MRGYSLPVVLFVISLGGAMAAGGAFVARQQAVNQRAATRSAGLEGMAQEWLGRTLASWDTTGLTPIGTATALPSFELGGTRVNRWVTRTDTSVYWIVVEVSRWSKPLMRRRLGAPAIAVGNRLLLVSGWSFSELP